MNREQQKNDIILIAKNAIADNAEIDPMVEFVTIEINEFDHICEEIADKIYDAGYHKEEKEDKKTKVGNVFFKRSIEFEKDREAFCKAYDKLHADYVAVLKHNAYLRNELWASKAEAVKEFAGKLKERLNADYVNGHYNTNKYRITEFDIDEILKEFEV